MDPFQFRNFFYLCKHKSFKKRISKICTWLGILFSVSVQIPSTFRNLVDRIEEKVSPKGQLDPKIGHTIKEEACYQGGIGGQKNFMDSAIINKEFWSSTFC